MIKSALFSVYKRRTKDTIHRIIRGADKHKGTIQSLVNSLSNIPKRALKRWNKAVWDLKTKEILKSLKTAKITKLEQVVKRTTKDAINRMIGITFKSSKLWQFCIKFYNLQKRRPKQAFDKWKSFIHAINNEFLLEQLRSLKIQFTLMRISYRVLRDCYQRILGQGNKMNGAFLIMILKVLRRPKCGFDRWKTFMFSMNQMQLKKSLNLFRLKYAFFRVTLRTFRISIQSIVKGGNWGQEAFICFFKGLKSIQVNFLDKLNKIVKEIEDWLLMDNCKRPTGKLVDFIRKLLKNLFKIGAKISFPKYYAKTMLKRLEQIIRQKPKIFFLFWKDFIGLFVNKKSLRNLRARILKNSLKKALIRNFYRCGLQILINQNKRKKNIFLWKIFANLCQKQASSLRSKAIILNSCLKRLINKTFFNCSLSIANNQNKIKKFGFLFLSILKNKFKRVFFILTTSSYIDCIEKASLENKSLKLRFLLGSFINKRMSVILQEFIKYNEKNVRILRNFRKYFKIMPKFALKTWIKNKNLIKESQNSKIISQSFRFEHVINRLQWKRQKLCFENLKSTDLRELKKNIFLIKLKKNLSKILCKSFKKLKKYKRKLGFLSKKSTEIIQKFSKTIEKLEKTKIKQKFKIAKKVHDLLYKSKKSFKSLDFLSKRIMKQGLESWKTEKNKKKKIFKDFKFQRLKNLLKRIIIKNLWKPIKDIIEERNGIKDRKNLKFALEKWKKHHNNLKSFDCRKSSWFKRLLNNILRRLYKFCFSKIIYSSVNKDFLSKFVQVFNKLKENINKINYSSKLKVRKGLQLQNYLQKLAKKHLRTSFFEINSFWANRKDKILRFLCQIYKDYKTYQKSHYYNQWQKKTLLILFYKKQSLLKGKHITFIIKNLIFSAKKQAVFSMIKTVVYQQKLYKRLESLSIKKLQKSMKNWKSFMENYQNDSKIHKGILIFRRFTQKQAKKIINSILHPYNPSKIIKKLVLSLSSLQKTVITALKERVYKFQLIKKIKSSYKILKLLKKKGKIMVEGRFFYWKNLESLRIYRIKKKVLMKMIFLSSISYQNSFWKMKFVWTKNFRYFDPKHSLMYRKLCKIADNYQTRLKQFAHFKILLFEKGNFVNDKQVLLVKNNEKYARRRSFEVKNLNLIENTPKIRTRALTPSGPRETIPKSQETPKNPLFISYHQRNLSQTRQKTWSKLSKEEITGINQLGAAEVICKILSHTNTKFIVAGLTALEVFYKHSLAFDLFKARFVKQMNELKLEKESLMKANFTLRKHNELLIENLEKTNYNFEALSWHLGWLKVDRMSKVVFRLIQMSVFQSFTDLKNFKKKKTFNQLI